MTTDKKLGLERFQVSVATKQTLPAMICQMQRVEIILHVKRILLKHVIAVFNQTLHHRSLRKNRCNFRCKDYTHNCTWQTRILLLNISLDFEQNLSSLRLSFDALIGRLSAGVLPALLIK